MIYNLLDPSLTNCDWCLEWHHRIQASALKVGWQTRRTHAPLDEIATLPAEWEVVSSKLAANYNHQSWLAPRIYWKQVEWHWYGDSGAPSHHCWAADVTFYVFVAGNAFQLLLKGGTRVTLQVGQGMMVDAATVRQILPGDATVLVAHGSLSALWWPLWHQRWSRPVYVHGVPHASSSWELSWTSTETAPTRVYPQHEATLQATRNYGAMQKLPRHDVDQARQVYALLVKLVQQPVPPANCRNEDSRCGIMAAMGSCEHGSHQYMAEYCAPLCDLCGEHEEEDVVRDEV